MDIEALHQHFSTQAQLPQRLGVIDCVTFVGEALKVGWQCSDVLEHMAYWDRRSAVKQLRRGGGLEQCMIDAFGPTRGIADLVDGGVIWCGVGTIGLLIDEAVYVKGNYDVHRVMREDNMIGWSIT